MKTQNHSLIIGGPYRKPVLPQLHLFISDAQKESQTVFIFCSDFFYFYLIYYLDNTRGPVPGSSSANSLMHTRIFRL